MRKFVAGACCLIVGLQVLVGVPLVVCLVFYGLTQGGGPIAVQVNPSSFEPCTVPPPSYSPSYSAAPYLPGPPASLGPTVQLPSLPPPIPASFAGPPAPMDHPDENASAAIAEVRERNGNPLAETFVAAAPPSRPSADSSPTLRPVLASETASVLPAAESSTQPPASSHIEQANEAVSPPVASQPKSAPDAKSEARRLIASLQSSVELLYTLCATYEVDGNYGRADQVRKLARDIRDEVDIIRRHELPPPEVSAASLDGPAAPPVGPQPKPVH